MRTSGSDAPQVTVSTHNLSMPLQPVFTSPPPWIGAEQQFSQYNHQNIITHGRGIGDGQMPQTTVSVHNLSMPLQPVAVVFTSPCQSGGTEQQSNRYIQQ